MEQVPSRAACLTEAAAWAQLSHRGLPVTCNRPQQGAIPCQPAERRISAHTAPAAVAPQTQCREHCPGWRLLRGAQEEPLQSKPGAAASISGCRPGKCCRCSGCVSTTAVTPRGEGACEISNWIPAMPCTPAASQGSSVLLAMIAPAPGSRAWRLLGLWGKKSSELDRVLVPMVSRRDLPWGAPILLAAGEGSVHPARSLPEDSHCLWKELIKG